MISLISDFETSIFVNISVNFTVLCKLTGKLSSLIHIKNRISSGRDK